MTWYFTGLEKNGENVSGFVDKVPQKYCTDTAANTEQLLLEMYELSGKCKRNLMILQS